MELSRKAFVTGAGAAAAAMLAGASIAPADEACESWMPEAWDAEADAVVIGFGAAGASAAVDLADAGHSVVILEKMNYDLAGGDTSVFGGYITQIASSDPIVCGSLAGVDAAYAEAIIPYYSTVHDYLKGIGVEIDTETFEGIAMPVRQEGEAFGPAFFRSLRSVVEARSDMIAVMYETPGVALVQDPVTGEVLGVKAGSAEAPVFVKARLGVVVATGSYEGDRQMTNALHMPGLCFPTIGAPGNTGDGLKMLMKAGCKVQNIGKTFEYAAMAVAPASEEVGVGLVLPFNFVNDGYIIVNAEGKRFANETTSIQHSKDDGVLCVNKFAGGLGSNMETTRYVNLPAFMVFDEATKAAQAIAGTNGNGNGWNVHTRYQWSADNEAELQKGWIFKADTLEELAQVAVAYDMWGHEVHMDAEGLVEQVARYNEACDAGEDAEFGRAVGAKVAEGPYYAAELVPATLYATGGASHDANAQAVDWADRPIPRLYVAGLVGDPFTVHAPCLSGAVAWGRRAAEMIAGLEAWA